MTYSHPIRCRWLYRQTWQEHTGAHSVGRHIQLLFFMILFMLTDFYQIYVQYLSYQHILWTVPLNVTAIDCHRCIFLQFHWKQTKFKHNTKKYNYIIWSDIITSSTSVEDNLIPILTVPDFLHCDLHGSNIKNPRR